MEGAEPPPLVLEVMICSQVFNPGIFGNSFGSAMLVTGNLTAVSVYWNELGFTAEPRASELFTVIR